MPLILPNVTFSIYQCPNHAIPSSSFWILSPPMPVFGQYIRVGEVHGRCKGTDYVNAEAIEAFSSIVRHCRQGKGQGAQSYVSPVQVRPSVNRSRIPCGHEVLILRNQVLAIKSG